MSLKDTANQYVQDTISTARAFIEQAQEELESLDCNVTYVGEGENYSYPPELEIAKDDTLSQLATALEAVAGIEAVADA